MTEGSSPAGPASSILMPGWRARSASTMRGRSLRRWPPGPRNNGTMRTASNPRCACAAMAVGQVRRHQFQIGEHRRSLRGLVLHAREHALERHRPGRIARTVREKNQSGDGHRRPWKLTAGRHSIVSCDNADCKHARRRNRKLSRNARRIPVVRPSLRGPARLADRAAVATDSAFGPGSFGWVPAPRSGSARHAGRGAGAARQSARRA